MTNEKYYSPHEDAYRKFKERGNYGWHTKEEQEKSFAMLDRILTAEYYPRTGKTLELGCGDGEKSLWLATKGYEATGVELSPTAVEWAKEKAKVRGISVRFFVDDVLHLKTQESDSFDIVLDAECLHCITGAGRAMVLGSVHRVLKPGGIFLVASMCQPLRNPEGWVKPPMSFDYATGILYSEGKPYRHIGRPEDIMAELGKAGYELLWHEREEGKGEGKDQGWDRIRVAARRRERS